MAQTLERHCLKRFEGGATKRAPACTKEDLRILMDGLYFDAASSKDFQDAALLALMWYAFGRASDLGFVAKSNLTVSADGVVFVRLLRVKTSEEQGISIFPDQVSFVTCDCHGPGNARYTKLTSTALSSTCYRRRRENRNTDRYPFSKALAACDGDNVETAPETSSEPRTKKRKTNEDNMKIHAYVNRIVKAASEAQTRTKPTPNLTSHSLRRGSAQHANGDDTLSAQWIFDRGSWNMTSTNKAFAYVFNTTSEDQKVARILSGWDASDKPQVPTLSWFDSATRKQARDIANLLFQTSICAEDPSKRLSDRVCEVLTASLIQHFPEVLEQYPMCPYVSRMRIILFELGIEKAQVLAWSSELQRKAMNKNIDPEGNGGDKLSREDTLINLQNCVISELVAMNQALAKRVTELEKQQAQREEDISV